MKIRVLKSHIKKGIPRQFSSCPVALAVKKAMPGCRRIEVGYGWISVDGNDIRIPNKVEEFIKNFDKGKKVEPFEFNLPSLKG